MKLNIVIIILLVCTSFLRASSPDFTNSNISVAAHGANGSDLADDTTAFNAAIAYCKNNGYKTLFIPCGTYYISSSLTDLNSSFSVINVVGENATKTIINLSGIAPCMPAMKTSGGSGGLANSEISSITFIGSGDEYGLEIKGTCGVRIKGCKFENLGCGIVFSNDIASGTFTEYCIAEDCYFGTKTAVYYKRGAGDASFHGTGLKGCIINNMEGDTTPVIKIGEDSSPDIHLYNAPMDFQVWVRQDINIIEAKVSPQSKITTYGTITLEIFGGNPVVAKSKVPVYHHGNVISWDSHLTFGDIQLIDWSATNVDGSINVSRRPFSISKTLNAAVSAISETSTTMLGSLITVELSASNYDYRYLLFINHNGYGADGYVSIVANPRAFNQAGLGVPVFSVNSYGQLVITNSSYASTPVMALFNVTPMGQRNEYFIGK